MSPWKRMAWAAVISAALHVMALVGLGGHLSGNSGRLRLPGLLFVEFIKLSGRGAEARVLDRPAPFELQTGESPEESEVPPALSTRPEKGEGKTRGEKTLEKEKRPSTEEQGIEDGTFYQPAAALPEVRPEEREDGRPGNKPASPQPEPGLRIEPPTCATCPAPHYPELARRRGLEGDVALRFQVLPDGRVGDVFVEKSSGFQVLDEAAMSAVKSWTFFPATEHGEPVTFTQTRIFHFRMRAP